MRGCLPANPKRDLYHFKKKSARLEDCVTQLGPEFDPDGLHDNFGYIASPKNFINDLANPDAKFRRELAQAINRLPAEYVILDLRAGLDDNVLDFLPYSNSGILVFTPHHPAATVAASEIVKAILFRSLRILFGKGSSFFSLPKMERYYKFINDLIDQVEDVYDSSIPNLDSFLAQLREALGEHPILHAISDTLESFRVHYVLNLFNGIDQSYEQAVVPFADNISRNVSNRLHLTQLGWVVEDPRVHESNRSGFPMVLDRRTPSQRQKKKRTRDPIMDELAALESSVLGLKRPERRKSDPSILTKKAETTDLLEGQLQTLKAMYSDRKKDTVKENLSYITYRALNLMSSSYGPNEFGTTQLASPERLLDWYLSRQSIR